MIYANDYINSVREYAVASHEIWRVSPQQRREYLKLDWNEATIQPSPKVYESIKELLDDDGFFNLYPMLVNQRIIELLADYTRVDERNIQYFASSDSLHEYLTKVYLNRHSTVVLLGPSYDNFRLTAETCGARIVNSDYTDDFELDKGSFENDIYRYSPTLVYICNPNNPTGNCLSHEYIEKLLKTFPDTLFLVDEAYWEFSEVTVADLVNKYDNLAISRTLSKAFALANFRFGYLLANEQIIKNINKVRNPKNITTFAQAAVTGALSDITYMQRYVKEVQQSREYLISGLSRYHQLGKPYKSEGNFVLVKCCDATIKKNYLEYLSRHKIYIRDVKQRPSVYNCVRITVGTREQMEVFMQNTKMFINTFLR